MFTNAYLLIFTFLLTQKDGFCDRQISFWEMDTGFKSGSYTDVLNLFKQIDVKTSSQTLHMCT